jgi:anti-anti-sigma factor
MLNHPDFIIEDHHSFFIARFLCSIDMDKLLTLKPVVEAHLPLIQKNLLVDLEHVSFLDSAAVGILVILMRHVRQIGQKIVIFQAQPQAEAVLHIVGLSDYVPLALDQSEAEKTLL